MTKITEHFKKCFTNELDSSVILPSKLTFDPILVDEVERNKHRLKNKRAPGPDGLTAEELKFMDSALITEKLNSMIEERDEILTHGHIAPILKPGKNMLKTESYRPIILPSVWRKLLSMIVLRRIEGYLDERIDRSQHAHSRNKSTGDVVLTHKLLYAASIERKFDPKVVGIDMSKAFDTVRRSQLLQILQDIIDPGNLNIIKVLFSNTTLSVKMNKIIGERFQTNRGVPQGDSLSPKLFNVYVNEALSRIDNITNLNDHDYSLKYHSLPRHIEYADDVDFIMLKENDEQKLLEVVENVFSEFNLSINHEKTEITLFGTNSNLSKVKKLGSLLDDLADIDRRDNLCQIALKKYTNLWKNRYINNTLKVQIYNVFIRPIMIYNSSTWFSNKAVENKLDVIQRKHFRKILNIYYPKKIRNEALYALTNCGSLSLEIKKYRKRHLGHVLRRDSTFKDTLRYIQTIPKRSRGKRPPNILKTYRKDFGTEEWLKLEDLAFARTI